MKTTYFAAIILFIFAAGPVYAQALKGSVVEKGSNERIPNVFIRDLNAKAVTLTDKKGNFEISTSAGHTLVFSSPGYTSDTLYVIDLNPKRIELIMQGITLRQVTIQSSRTAFNPQAEYPDVYRKSKVYIFSPSSWLSKEGHNARRLKRYFAREIEERHVDSVFSRVYVSSLIPLRGEELDSFMMLYRPSYAYIMDNNGPSLAVYINDAYKKYKALPPEKQKIPSLTGN